MSSSMPDRETPVPGLDRRRFIAAALAVSAAMLPWQRSLADTATAAAGIHRAAGAGGTSATALLGTLGNPAAAGRLGAAYLSAYPDEADLDVLVHQLTGALGTGADTAAVSQEALMQALVDRVEQEYCTAPLVRADGWLLAPSEARLYALAALVQGADTT
jgi:hypothetical protein